MPTRIARITMTTMSSTSENPRLKVREKPLYREWTFACGFLRGKSLRANACLLAAILCPVSGMVSGIMVMKPSFRKKLHQDVRREQPQPSRRAPPARDRSGKPWCPPVPPRRSKRRDRCCAQAVSVVPSALPPLKHNLHYVAWRQRPPRRRAGEWQQNKPCFLKKRKQGFLGVQKFPDLQCFPPETT